MFDPSRVPLGWTAVGDFKLAVVAPMQRSARGGGSAVHCCNINGHTCPFTAVTLNGPPH